MNDEDFYKRFGIDRNIGYGLDMLVKQTMVWLAKRDGGEITPSELYISVMAQIRDQKQREIAATLIGWHIGLMAMSNAVERKFPSISSDLSDVVAEYFSSQSASMFVGEDGKLNF